MIPLTSSKPLTSHFKFLHLTTVQSKTTLRRSPLHTLATASAADTATSSSPSSSPSTLKTSSPVDLQKQNLLETLAGTQRGSDAGSLKRGLVEEAQVAVEALSTTEINWDLLEGIWNLVYTTASDVVPIVRPGAGLPGFPLKVGRVGQRFTSVDQGICQNIIEIEALFPIFSGTKATLVVEASYEVRTSKSIALTFKKAGVAEVEAGNDLQNALASPLLPRGMWNMQALMAVAEFSAFIPLTTRPAGTTSSTRRPSGINYNITYLDEDLFIGRAQANGGTFIFPSYVIIIMTDIASISSSLKVLVSDQLQPVTFKWVARHFNIPYDTSKRVLFDFLSKQGQKVQACFLLSGWTKDEEPRHVVQVIDGSKLESAKAALGVITALHVYSVQPAEIKDLDKLQNCDYSQTEQLFRKMLVSATDPSPLAANVLTTVRCPNAKRDPSLSSVKSAAVVAAPKPEPGSSKPAPAPKTKAPSPAKKPAAAPSPASKKKEAPKKKAAIVESDSEDEMPAAVAKIKGKRMAIDDSESEDDVPAAKQAKQAKPEEEKPKKKANKRKAAAEEDEEPEQGPKYGTVKVHEGAPSGKRTKRVMKTYFNDAGEEVTEMVEETDDEEPAAPAPAPAPPSKPKPAPASKSAGAGSKKSSGKGAPAAGQRSIASFFGKK